MDREVDADTPEAALQLLSDTRGAVRFHRRALTGGLRLVHRTVGPITFDTVEFRLDADVEVGPGDRLVFGHLREGAVGFRTHDGQENWYSSGDTYLAAHLDRPRRTLARHGLHSQLVLDPAVLDAVAQTDRHGSVRFTGHNPISPQANALFASACDFVRATVLSNPEPLGRALLESNAARFLAAAALHAFPTNTIPAPTDSRDASPAAFRRAMTFIDEHAHEPITPADIAAAAFVTIRSVQLAFRRNLGTAPMAYVRSVRLDHAHRELLATSPATNSVTAVAYRWGFAGPSRFSAHYRRAYGVPPSATLRS
jgi:AraC-like DNA-binding protein